MKGKIEELIAHAKMDETTRREVLITVKAAAEEFPCLACASKDECASFKWFLKWFGKSE